MSIARDNHFIPQSYTRGWATDGKVWRYHLLAPAESVEVWQEIPVVKFGRFRDLYTSVRTGADSDEDERWLNEEVEDPAAEPLRKVRADQKLTREEWRRLTRYVFALRYRTVASYFESMERWNRTVPELLSSTLRDAKRRLDEAARKRAPLVVPMPEGPPERPLLRVKVEAAAEPGKSLLHAQVRLDRELWLYQLREALTRHFAKLPDYSWSVLTPYRDGAWFTSDHPVMLIRYKGIDDYEFDIGGWKVNKLDIMVPISPRHMLHASVGRTLPASHQITGELTIELQRMVARHAFRSIVAHAPSTRATLMRPRRVDLDAFNSEREAHLRWHEQQSEDEGEARSA